MLLTVFEVLLNTINPTVYYNEMSVQWIYLRPSIKLITLLIKLLEKIAN